MTLISNKILFFTEEIIKVLFKVFWFEILVFGLVFLTIVFKFKSAIGAKILTLL